MTSTATYVLVAASPWLLAVVLLALRWAVWSSKWLRHARAGKSDYVPLSVRYGPLRRRVGWALLGIRERVALWLAPWLLTSAKDDATFGASSWTCTALNQTRCPGERDRMSR